MKAGSGFRVYDLESRVQGLISPILILNIPRACLHLLFDNRGIPPLTDQLVVAENERMTIMSTLTWLSGVVVRFRDRGSGVFNSLLRAPFSVAHTVRTSKTGLEFRI